MNVPGWLVAALLATLGAVAGCSLGGSGSGEVEALELEVGNCFNGPGSEASEVVLTVMVVGCDESHDFEIYHSFDLDGDEYPGDEAVEDLWIAGCLPEFERFVGLAFDESDLDISAIFPTATTWNDLGDREVLCSVTAVDGRPRTASAADARV